MYGDEEPGKMQYFHNIREKFYGVTFLAYHVVIKMVFQQLSVMPGHKEWRQPDKKEIPDNHSVQECTSFVY